MQVVILAAGQGVRMRPLTLTTPKPMLKVAGKPILEHLIESLPREVDDLIIVIGHLGEQIRQYFGATFDARSIRYVEQVNHSGTFDALKLCESLLHNERFMVLYADDLHDTAVLQRCIDLNEMCLVLCRAENPSKYGVVELDTDGRVISFEEKPEHPKSNLISYGAMVLTKEVFKHPPQVKIKGENYLATAIAHMINDYPIYGVVSDFRLGIGNIEELREADRILREKETANRQP